MSNIASLIGMVCVCAAAVSLLSIISPNGMTSKTLNLVIGVFIVCVMIVPIKNAISDFSFEIPHPEISEEVSEKAREAYDKAVITETETRLKKTLFSSLSADGLNVDTVDIELGENNDGGIYISRISIYIDKAETRLGDIIRRTEKEFGVTPKIISRQ